MFHFHCGTQYAARSFRKFLDSLGEYNHFQRKAIPLIIHAVSVFFKYLKKQEYNRRTHQDINELQLPLFQYIEGFYNPERPHGSLGLMSPDKKERDDYLSK